MLINIYKQWKHFLWVVSLNRDMLKILGTKIKVCCGLNHMVVWFIFSYEFSVDHRQSCEFDYTQAEVYMIQLEFDFTHENRVEREKIVINKTVLKKNIYFLFIMIYYISSNTYDHKYHKIFTFCLLWCMISSNTYDHKYHKIFTFCILWCMISSNTYDHKYHKIFTFCLLWCMISSNTYDHRYHNIFTFCLLWYIIYPATHTTTVAQWVRQLDGS